MAEHSGVKGFIGGIASNAAWEWIKGNIGGPAMMATAVAVWGKIRHGSLDWVAILGMFAFSLLLLWVNSRQQQAKHVEPSVPLPLPKANGAIEQPKPWEGYESEAVWREATASQTRLIELGRGVDGLFTLLQLESFQLAKDLGESLSAIPAPNQPVREQFPSTPKGNNDYLIAFSAAWKPYEKEAGKVQAKYRQRINGLLLRLRAEGVEDDVSIEHIFVQTANKDYMKYVQEKIIAMAHELDGVRLVVRYPGGK